MRTKLLSGLLAASLLWLATASPIDEWGEALAKVATHEHWEHLVRRSAESAGAEDIKDDTAHIKDVQAYYRDVFASDSDWDSASALHLSSQADVRNLLVMQSLQAYLQAKDDQEKAKIEAADDSLVPDQSQQKKIKGRYIVTMSSESTDDVLDRTLSIMKYATSASQQRLRADHITTFRRAGKGFTGTLSSKMVELLHKHPLVTSIEEDIAIRKSYSSVSSESYPNKGKSDTVSDPSGTTNANSNVKPSTEGTAVPWNLDRIDQHIVSLDGQYNPEGTGKGVDVFIVDTGIRYTHADLGGRAKYAGLDVIDKLTGSDLKGADCQGHGSHVAGIVGGNTYGVAKQATLYSVRALDCGGTGAVSGVITALEYIASYPSNNPKVISLSLGVDASTALDNGLREVVNNHGIATVAAAGNNGLDACKFSPASSGVTIDVGATDSGDEVASFSNTGACLDVFAPGKMIESVGFGCDTCTKAMSGTSMACPHVTGYVAVLLELQPNLKPAQVLENVLSKSTKDAVRMTYVSDKSTADSTPNRLLYIPSLGAADADLSARQK